MCNTKIRDFVCHGLDLLCGYGIPHLYGAVSLKLDVACLGGGYSVHFVVVNCM